MPHRPLPATPVVESFARDDASTIEKQSERETTRPNKLLMSSDLRCPDNQQLSWPRKWKDACRDPDRRRSTAKPPPRHLQLPNRVHWQCAARLRQRECGPRVAPPTVLVADRRSLSNCF